MISWKVKWSKSLSSQVSFYYSNWPHSCPLWARLHLQLFKSISREILVSMKMINSCHVFLQKWNHGGVLQLMIGKYDGNIRLKLAKNQAKVKQHQRLNFCYLNFIRFFHPRYHSKMTGHILKNVQEKKICFNDIVWLIRLIRLIKNRSHKCDINRIRPRGVTSRAWQCKKRNKNAFVGQAFWTRKLLF